MFRLVFVPENRSRAPCLNGAFDYTQLNREQKCNFHKFSTPNQEAIVSSLGDVFERKALKVGNYFRMWRLREFAYSSFPSS